MTELDISPAPWTWDEDVFLVDADGNMLLDEPNGLEEAECHLVAAAPDLYAALNDLLSYSGGAANALDDPYVVERARLALNKAVGAEAEYMVEHAQLALAKARGIETT